MDTAKMAARPIKTVIDFIYDNDLADDNDRLMDFMPFDEHGKLIDHRVITATEGDEGTPIMRDQHGQPWVPLVGDEEFFAKAHRMANSGVISREEAGAMLGLVPGSVYELPPGTEIQITPNPRVEALSVALITAVTALEKATSDETRDGAEEQAIVEGLRETLTDLGLTHRLAGNPADAEQVMD